MLTTDSCHQPKYPYLCLSVFTVINHFFVNGPGTLTAHSMTSTKYLQNGKRKAALVLRRLLLISVETLLEREVKVDEPGRFYRLAVSGKGFEFPAANRVASGRLKQSMAAKTLNI